MSVSFCFWEKIHTVNYILSWHSFMSIILPTEGLSSQTSLALSYTHHHSPNTFVLPAEPWLLSQALPWGSWGPNPETLTKLYSQAWVSFSDWCLIFFVWSVCTPKPHLESPSAVHPQPCFSSKSKLGIRAVGVSAESGPRHLCSVVTYILQLISRSGLCWQIEGVSQMSPGPKERIAARISRNTRELLGELINQFWVSVKKLFKFYRHKWYQANINLSMESKSSSLDLVS